MNTPTTPHYARTGRTRIREVMHSLEEYAVIATVMIVAGFMEMLPGLVLSRNRSRGGNKGLFVPYIPNTYTNVNSPFMVGRSFVLADVADGDTTLMIDIEDSRRLVVGDDLVIDDSDTACENLGAIVSIVTTSGRYATVTFTNPVTAAAGFLVSKSANVYVNTGWCATVAANVDALATTFTVANTRIDELAETGMVLKKGDTMVLVDDGTDAENLGAVTDIARGATNTTITVTTATAGTFTTADNAIAYVLRDNNAWAECILTRNRDGGDNGLPNVSSIMASAAFKQVSFYTNALGNLDTNAMADLGAKKIQDITYF